MLITLFIPDETAMLTLGAQWAACCPTGVVIFLYGQLGAGKTTLTRGFLRGLGYEGKVKSPTYTLVEPYEFNDFSLFHFDFYRVHHEQELEFIGIQDYFTEHSICLIEWPEQGGSLLPLADLSCYIAPKAEGREVKISANTERGDSILRCISIKNG